MDAVEVLAVLNVMAAFEKLHSTTIARYLPSIKEVSIFSQNSYGDSIFTGKSQAAGSEQVLYKKNGLS